jgi:hypothetical protein
MENLYINNKRIVFLLGMAPPFAVTVTALASLEVFLLPGSELRFFDHRDAPSDSLRLIGVVVVIILNIVAAIIVDRCKNDASPRRDRPLYTRRLLNSLSIVALLALGAAFAVLDMTFCIGESRTAALIALALGLIAAGPMFFRKQGGVRWLLVAVAIYGLFAAWIAVQREIDWNMRRHFLRAYSQIHPGMTREQVEEIMSRQFRTKRPVLIVTSSGLLYRLDPGDGRFNSEFMDIDMVDGKVVSTYYAHEE